MWDAKVFSCRNGATWDRNGHAVRAAPGDLLPLPVIRTWDDRLQASLSQ